MTPGDLGEYLLFATTLELGSITAAAAALELSRPTLSRRLAALEERLGLALLHRTTRRLSPTPAGRRLYDQMRPLLEEMRRIETQLVEERDAVTGRLRVSAPPVLAPELARLLVALRREHPALEIELVGDIRWADLRSDAIDVAVRAGRIQDRELVQRRLTTADVSAVAAPGYLARRRAPSTLEELSTHELLRGHGPDGHPQAWWPLRNGERVAVSGGFTSNDQLALREAALADGGIALLSEVESEAALVDGRLVRILPELLGTPLRLHAVYARRRLQPARVRIFVEALVAWFADREPPLFA
ncbi:MAG: LysR family transcriptional regulator [Sandaracinaceae bacterium]